MGVRARLFGGLVVMLTLVALIVPWITAKTRTTGGDPSQGSATFRDVHEFSGLVWSDNRPGWLMRLALTVGVIAAMAGVCKWAAVRGVGIASTAVVAAVTLMVAVLGRPTGSVTDFAGAEHSPVTTTTTSYPASWGTWAASLLVFAFIGFALAAVRPYRSN